MRAAGRASCSNTAARHVGSRQPGRQRRRRRLALRVRAFVCICSKVALICQWLIGLLLVGLQLHPATFCMMPGYICVAARPDRLQWIMIGAGLRRVGEDGAPNPAHQLQPYNCRACRRWWRVRAILTTLLLRQKGNLPPVFLSVLPLQFSSFQIGSCQCIGQRTSS